MTQYGTYNTAYKEENLNQHPRVSADVPASMDEWREIINNTPVVVLYIWSNHCQPCLRIRDKYESLAAKYQDDNVKFYKDNIDNPMCFHKGQVDAVPAFILLVDGREARGPNIKGRHTGWTEEMIQTIPQLLQYSAIYQRQQQKPERLVCKNNVCYIQRE